MTNTRAHLLYDAHKRSLLIAYLLWFFLGVAAVHRFYAGRTGSAVLMLALLGGSLALLPFGIGLLTIWLWVAWLLLDAILLPGLISRYNTRLIDRLTRGAIVC